MHSYGTGHKQSGGVGNSGYSDQQIDDMFGDQKGSLYQLLGMDKPPDWSNMTWDTGGEVLGSNRLKREQEANANLAKLTDLERGDLINRNRQWLNENETMPNANETWLKDMMAREKEQAEVEKLLGYKLGGQ
jgi:hypothetical protein